MHERVRGELAEPAGPWPAGTGYSAFDPELMLWTVAVIADSAQAFFETLVRPLGPRERDELWRDYIRFGELFGMPREVAPPDYRGFREYWEGMWTGGELHLTDEAREVALAIAFEIPLPRYLHPSREVHNLVLTGTLPPRVRELFGLDWSPLQAAAFKARGGRAASGAPGDPARAAPGRQHRTPSTSSRAPSAAWSRMGGRRCPPRRGAVGQLRHALRALWPSVAPSVS